MSITFNTQQCALITGASRGIGRACASLLSAYGVPVVVNYRSAEGEATRLVEEIRASGGTAIALQADVSNPDEARRLVDQADSRLGGIGILVNNAGITRDRLLLQMTAEDWDATWCTDLAGSRAAARRALHCMLPRGSGRIVNLSSVVGITGNAGQANYAAAKSAVTGLTRQLAIEAAPSGVTVNCVVPGFITTDATSHLTEQQTAVWLQRIPMGRAATADEVAAIVIFLASDQAAYLTGQCIAVDGGLLASAGGGLAS
jgi:3-oxoacyl-[acyl-carrier protein] reductase